MTIQELYEEAKRVDRDAEARERQRYAETGENQYLARDDHWQAYRAAVADAVAAAACDAHRRALAARRQEDAEYLAAYDVADETFIGQRQRQAPPYQRDCNPPDSFAPPRCLRPWHIQLLPSQVHQQVRNTWLAYDDEVRRARYARHWTL